MKFRKFHGITRDKNVHAHTVIESDFVEKVISSLELTGKFERIY